MPSSVTATGGSKDIFMKQPHTLAWENHRSDFRSETDVSYRLGDSPHTFIDHLMGLCVPNMSAAFSWFVIFSIFKKRLIDWQRSPFSTELLCYQYFIFNIHYPFQVKQHLRFGRFVLHELIHFQPSCCCVLCMYLEAHAWMLHLHVHGPPCRAHLSYSNVSASVPAKQRCVHRDRRGRCFI